jgi:hypothetical protein
MATLGLNSLFNGKNNLDVVDGKRTTEFTAS